MTSGGIQYRQNLKRAPHSISSPSVNVRTEFCPPAVKNGFPEVIKKRRHRSKQHLGVDLFQSPCDWSRFERRYTSYATVCSVVYH